MKLPFRFPWPAFLSDAGTSRSWFVRCLTGVFVCVGLWKTVAGVLVVVEASNSAAWPGTPAEIVRSEVTESHTRSGTKYAPEVKYVYHVAGRRYQSRERYVGDDHDGRSNKEWAQAICDRYPAGSRITAYCDPALPERAVLEPGLWKHSWGPLHLGIGVLLLIGVIAGLLWLNDGL